MKRLFFLAAISPLAIMAQTKTTTKKPVPTTAKITPMAKVSPFKSSMDSFSYAIGMNIATNMKQQGLTALNTAMLSKAMNEVFEGKKTLIDEQTAGTTVQKVFMAISSKKSVAEKAEGQKYLATNKKRPGVMVTASGLQYEVLKAGDGRKPVDSNTVKVHYTGTLINGKKFDSSVDRGAPIEFPVTGVIAGWTEALKLMPVGSKWKLVIPSELAYGERGNQGIPSGATLIFEVELIAITK